MAAVILPELSWIDIARKNIGVKELPGPANSGIISGWLRGLKAWWLDDATPWCGTFVAHCLASSGLKYPKDWMRAKAYLELPVRLDRPAYGCIVVFAREGGGHVGFVVGQDMYGNLMVLGGNQGDAVNIKPFSKGRAIGYRWPSAYPSTGRFSLPFLNSNGQVSSNEQ